MTDTIGVYTSSSTSTATTTSTTDFLPGPDVDLQAHFHWVPVSGAAGRPELHMSAELQAEICEALAAADRGETEDLGSFAEYAECDDED